MKKALSLVLAAVMAATCLCLSSCAEASVGDIDGKTPGEYLTALLGSEVEAERYDVVEGMRIEVKALVLPLYGIELERLYVYSYDGENESLIMPKEAVDQLRENEFTDILDDHKGDVWYVDGVCYIDGRNAKEKYESSRSSIGQNARLKTLIKLLEDQGENVVCFENDGACRFVLELTEPDDMEMDIDCRREVYTVFVTPEGVLDSILIECITDGIITSTTSFTLNYVYDGLSPVEPPADADEYEET